MTGKLPTRPAARGTGRRDHRATARRADRAIRTTSFERAAPSLVHRHHGEELRIDFAAAILDRLDIARNLLRLQPIDTPAPPSPSSFSSRRPATSPTSPACLERTARHSRHYRIAVCLWRR